MNTIALVAFLAGATAGLAVVALEHLFRRGMSRGELKVLLEQMHQTLRNFERRVMNELLDLEQAVKDEDTVVDGVVTLLTGFADRLARLTDGQDPKALLALHDDIVAHKQALAAAVATVPPDTSAPPPAEPPPAEPPAGP